MYYSKKWLDLGIFIIFCVFNFGVVFLCSWLYLGGFKTLKAKLSPAARKQKQLNAQTAEKV